MKLDRSGLLLAAAAFAVGCGGRTGLRRGDGGGPAATPDASWTPCGDAGSCDPSTQYCKETIGGPPPGVDVHSCQQLVAGCHACDCVIAAGCTCIDDTGHITLTCQVP